MVDSVEARGLHLVPFDEWFAAGRGGLGAVSGDTHQFTVFSGG